MSLKTSSRSTSSASPRHSPSLAFLAANYADPPPYPFATTLIGRRLEKVRSINGPAVMPDLDMKQALADPPDLLMIPGGGGTWPLLNEKADPEGVAMLLDWVRQMDGKVKFMTSVCTGAAVLARAGLLNGLPGRDKSWRFYLGGKPGTKGPLGQRVPLGRRRSLRDVGRRVGRNGPRLLSGVETGWTRRGQKRSGSGGVRLASRPADTRSSTRQQLNGTTTSSTRKPREGQMQIEQSALVRVRNMRPTG